MKKPLRFLKGITLFFMTINCAQAQMPDSCIFGEDTRGGNFKSVITVDMESTNLNNGYWVKQTDVPGYLGDGYIQYVGGNATGVPGRSELAFTVEVSEAGPYSFKIRAYREGFFDNDVWVRFPEANVVVGKETNFTDTLETGKWIKAFIGPEDKWYHFAKTQLLGTAAGEDYYDIFVLFPGAGRYTVQFSGRANGFRMDRFVLYNLKYTTGFYAMNEANTETRVECVPYSNTSNPYVANPIPDQTVNSGSTWSYTIPDSIFKNPQGNNLAYVAKLSNMQNLPAGMTFNAATGTFDWSPQYADGGKYTILVTAKDNTTGKFTVDGFVLTVVGNNPPVIAQPIKDTIATVGETFTYQIPEGTFSDQDQGQTLTYTVASQLGDNTFRDWLTYDEGTRTFTGNPTTADQGNDTIYVTVNDGNGGEVTESFLITVKPLSVQGVFGASAKLHASVYPNPVENQVNIKVDEKGTGTLTLCDQAGRIFYADSGIDLSKEVSLDLAALDLMPGFYILKIKSERAGTEYHGVIIKK